MITATLAAWIPALTFEALPPRARSRAKLAIFDACGTALAGTHHPAVQHLRQLMVEMGSTPQARHRPSPPPWPSPVEGEGSRTERGSIIDPRDSAAQMPRPLRY